MTRFSKMLSAAAVTLFAALSASGPANADACGHGGCDRGYHGRTAGLGSHAIAPQHVNGVWVFRGGRTHAGQRTHHGVTVYSGGGAYLARARHPDFTGGLEVVTVINGGPGPDQRIDAVCVASHGHFMPAARAQAGDRLHGAAEGELFRCEDGFTLHAAAALSFGRLRGREIVCDSGLSLWRSGHGALSCRPKAMLACAPQSRSCGEAALRHAHGAGALTIIGRSQSGHPAVTVTRGMTLSGGVGYAPY